MSNPVIENAKTILPVESSGNDNNGHEEQPIWPDPQPLLRETPPP